MKTACQTLRSSRLALILLPQQAHYGGLLLWTKCGHCCLAILMMSTKINPLPHMEINNLSKNYHGKIYLRMSSLVTQHWLKEWLGAVKQQTIAWRSVDQVLRMDMASLAHNGLMKYGSLIHSLCGIIHRHMIYSTGFDPQAWLPW